MKSKLKPLSLVFTFVFLGWAAPALGLVHELSDNYTVSGTYEGAFVPFVTQVGDTILTTIDFEGLGDQQVIGTIIPGVTFSSNCLSLVDFDAGGSGNFANEPSPDTIAFFLTGNGCTITFTDPISDFNH